MGKLSNISEFFTFRASAIFTGVMEGVRIILTGVTVLAIPMIQKYIETNIPDADGKNAIIASWIFGGVFTAVFSKAISSLNTKYKDKKIKELKGKIGDLNDSISELKDKNLRYEIKERTPYPPDKSWKIHHLHILGCAKEEVISLLHKCLGKDPSKEEQTIILEATKKINESDIFKPEKQEMMYDFATKENPKNVEEEDYMKQKRENEKSEEIYSDSLY